MAGRCMAPVADGGPVAMYCGMVARAVDGRPVCTLHDRTGHAGTARFDDDDEPYPAGTGDSRGRGWWEFAYGPSRELEEVRHRLHRLVGGRLLSHLSPKEQAAFDQLTSRE